MIIHLAARIAETTQITGLNNRGREILPHTVIVLTSVVETYFRITFMFHGFNRYVAIEVYTACTSCLHRMYKCQQY